MFAAVSDPVDRDALALFSPAVRAWFAAEVGAPSRIQRLGWPRIAAGEHALLLAPTGSGKTLAAFLGALDRLLTTARTRPGYRVVYVSPLKALAYDVDKNLARPLAGITAAAAAAGTALPPVRVDVRTGDTPAGDRRRQGRDPGDVLITTPESLYLLLGSQARVHLQAVETVIVDEIHALAPTKRGAHLALSLERLSHLVTSAGGRDPQRIGLSATQRPLEVVARHLGGDRPVAIVDAGEPPRLDLQITVPVADMTAAAQASAPPPGVRAPPSERTSLWPAIYPHLLDLVLAHRTTIIFVNSRRLAERLAQELSDLALARGAIAPGEPLIRAHHGSVSRHERLAIEGALKDGRLRAITATSSLELGIDMATVDLVVQVESPGAVARGLQRIGRASHHVGGVPRGRIVPKFRGDLLEAAVVARGMRRGAVEPVHPPERCLDVLAQQLVAMCAVEAWRVADLERVIRRAAGYASLPRGALDAVLDMLSGRYPSDDFGELRPRLTWDRTHDVVVGRRGARLLSVVNAGTIPDRGLYAVHLGDGGPRLGELDEEMVFESWPGDTFLLGASSWRIVEITRDRVIVAPAPGEPGKLPFWRGEAPGRPVELGWAIGEVCRRLDEAGADVGALAAELDLDANGARNLVAYVAEQRAATGTVPTDRAITIERFRDEVGDWRVCVLCPLGARVLAPWAMIVARALEDRLGYPVHPVTTDDGFVVRLADGDEPPPDDLLVPDPDAVEELLVAELARSSVFAGRFRQAAARALLLPRRRPGLRTPLWSQRMRAQQLLGVALRYPSFPIVLEAYRECLRDVFDVPALCDALRRIRGGELRVESVTTTAPSPFARALVFGYVAAFLYEGDVPVAERRAQALTLDRRLLRELLGDEALRELLDPAVLAEVEAELQGAAPERRARHADALHDLLLRVGALSTDELRARAVDPAAAAGWIDDLAAAGRIVAVTIAGAPRWIAVEDAARYRDALGVVLPATVPPALLAPAPDAAVGVVARFARTHGPFTAAEASARLGLPPGQLALALEALEARGAVVSGELRPGGVGVEHCDADVLRALRRRTLHRLRAEVAAVPGAAYARLLLAWHGVGAGRRGPGALRDALARLDGAAVSVRELEAQVLPARVADFHPRMLDELGAAGELVWIGRAPLGARDGRIAICRRDRAALVLEAGALPEGATALARAIGDHLARAGASFLVAIEQAVAAPRAEVTAALWELVWAGVVTNDTFAPLRARGAASGRRVAPGGGFGGRWSLVAQVLATPAPVSPTARAHARALALLDRWAIVGAEAAAADELPAAGIADVLRAMEDAGKVRRGWFVDGLGGVQHAAPGAIDRLRGDAGRGVAVLAAVDPASPWGAVLPWPASRDASARPARRVGALVVLVDGACVLLLEPRGRRLTTFEADDATLERALAEGLPAAAARLRRSLSIEHLDGASLLDSPLTPVLERLGARRDYRALVISVRP